MINQLQNLQQSPTKNNGTTSPPSVSQSGTTLPKLQVGQILPIQILAVQGARVQFSFGNQPQTFIANLPPNLTLNPQDQARVEVKSTQPSLILQVVPSANKASSSSEIQINQLLKQLLPTQQANAKLLPNLIFDSKQLPAAVQAQVSQLIDSLLKPSGQLTGKDLKQQLLTSGLFFENNLKNKASSETIQSDLKAKLLQLQANTQKMSGAENLNGTVSKLLDKITLQQIQAIQQGHLNFEIPLQPNPLVEQIQIDIRKKTLTSEPSWEVFLDVLLNFEATEAELMAKVHLNGNDFSIYFWTENQALNTQLEANLENLKEAFKVNQLPLKQVMMSQIPLQPNENLQKISLIDIRV